MKKERKEMYDGGRLIVVCLFQTQQCKRSSPERLQRTMRRLAFDSFHAAARLTTYEFTVALGMFHRILSQVYQYITSPYINHTK